MRKKFIQYFPFGSLFKFDKLTKQIPFNCVVPLYHAVYEKPIAYINALYKHKSVAQFESDIDFLCKHFQPITLAELAAQVAKGVPFEKPSFHFTFDDGLRSFYDVIAPILLKKGIAATCFVNSQFLDNQDLMYRYKVGIICGLIANGAVKKLKPAAYYKQLQFSDLPLIDQTLISVDFDLALFLKDEKPYLDASQMQSLSAKGFSFGAHSVNHPNYAWLSDEEKIKQTKESLAALSFLNQQISAFAYPFTDAGISDKMLNQLAAMADITFGCAGFKTTHIANHLQRIDLEIGNLPAERIIKHDLIYQKLLSIVKK